MSSITRPVSAPRSIKIVNDGQFPADRWYSNEVIDSATTGTAAITANLLHLLPFIPPNDCRANAIAIPFAGGALVGNARVGIYESESFDRPYPTNLLFEVERSTNIGAGLDITACDVPLSSRKLYWLAHVQSVNKTLVTITTAQQPPLLGRAQATHTVPDYMIRIAFAYAALPNPFPANQAPVGGLTSQLIYLRLIPL